jgi:hypothetical protein
MKITKTFLLNVLLLLWGCNFATPKQQTEELVYSGTAPLDSALNDPIIIFSLISADNEFRNNGMMLRFTLNKSIIVDWGDGNRERISGKGEQEAYDEEAEGDTSLIVCHHKYKQYGHEYTVSIYDYEDDGKITYLNIANNNVVAVDVSKNIFLEKFICGHNKIKSLDITENIALIELSCSVNNLVTLNLKNNRALKFLHCGANSISNLDLSNNVNITSLHCENNQICNLDVNKNTLLAELYCGNNEISKFDVSTNKKLSILSCPKNKLSAIDLSESPSLQGLDCSDNIIDSLLITSRQIQFIHCSGNLLSSGAIDAVFESLPMGLQQDRDDDSDYFEPSTIDVKNNIGTDGCNTTIATNKGWIVKTKEE